MPPYADDLDPSLITVLGYAGNPFTWPATVELFGIRHVEGDTSDTTGIQPQFHRDEMNGMFSDVQPPSWSGKVQSTLWPIFQVNGSWFTFPAIEFWSDRAGKPRFGTGALVGNWQNWAYWIGDPASQWNPAIGKPIGFFLTAGDQRRMDVWAVRRRTNICLVTLAWGDCPRLTGTTEPVPVDPPPHPTPTPEPTPTPVPVPSTTDRADILALIAAVNRVGDKLEEQNAILKAGGVSLGQLVTAWK